MEEGKESTLFPVKNSGTLTFINVFMTSQLWLDGMAWDLVPASSGLNWQQYFATFNASNAKDTLKGKGDDKTKVGLSW